MKPAVCCSTMPPAFDALEAKLEARIEAGFRRMIPWNTATIIAALGACTAIARLG